MASASMELAGWLGTEVPLFIHVHELGGDSDAREIDEAGIQDSDSICLHSEGQRMASGAWGPQQGAAGHGEARVSEPEEAFGGPRSSPSFCRCESCVLKVTELVSVLRPPHEVASCGHLHHMAAW